MKKILFFLVAVFVLWQLLYNDAVSNALLALFVGGQLPFSGLVLSPQLIIGCTAGLIFLIVFFLLARFAPKRQIQETANQIPAETRKPVEVPVKIEEKAEVARAVAPIRPTVSPALYWHGNRLRIRRRLWLKYQLTLALEGFVNKRAKLRFEIHALTVKSRENFQGLHRYLLTTMRTVYVKSREKLHYGARACGQTLLFVLIPTYKGGVRGFCAGIRMAKTSWRMASPYLWRFDAWLERQSHAVAKDMASSIRSYDTLANLIDMASETLAILGLRRPDNR